MAGGPLTDGLPAEHDLDVVDVHHNPGGKRPCDERQGVVPSTGPTPRVPATKTVMVHWLCPFFGIPSKRLGGRNRLTLGRGRPIGRPLS